MLDTGHGGKTDAHAAHSVAVARWTPRRAGARCWSGAGSAGAGTGRSPRRAGAM